MMPKKAPRIVIGVLSVLVASALTAVFWLRFQLRDLGRVTVRFFDVGQGDAMLVTTPAGRQMLVDGGPDNALVHKLGRTMPVWDRTIELVVLTHPHADHLVGLVELLRRYRVPQVLVSDFSVETPEYEALRAEMARQGVALAVAAGPARQVLEPGLELEVLYPPAGEIATDNPNDASVVIRLVHGENSVLLTGDLEAPAQRRLPAEWLSSDVLKVAHHGSADALEPQILAAIQPQLAVISVGKNTYGHPSRRVVRALERLGATVLTTQAEGDIMAQSDGTRWRFVSQQHPRLTVIGP